MCSQLIVRKALSWGIIGTPAPMLAAITIRKSQEISCGVLFDPETILEGHALHDLW